MDEHDKNKHNQEKTDDLSIDLKNIDFKKIAKFAPILTILLFLLIPMYLSYHYRIQPQYMPALDDFASQRIDQAITSQVQTQVNQEYPNLPDENKKALITQKVTDFKKQKQAQIEQETKKLAENSKNFRKDSDGSTYLLAIDPYFYYRHVRNLVEKGHLGDEVRDGVQINTHMVAPKGSTIKPILHHYAIYYTHSFLKIFNSDRSLMNSTFYVPILISLLCIIPAFFLTRKIAGNFGGLVAGLIVALNQNFLTRTVGGFSDTDAYIVLFSLLVGWMIIESFYAKNTKTSLIFAGLGGLFTGLFAFAWSGWWFMFDFVIATIVSYMIYELIVSIVHEKQEKLKNPNIIKSLKTLGVFIILAGIFTTLFIGIGPFVDAPTKPITAIMLKEVAKADLWPNVYTTVAELNEASMMSILNSMGGILLLVIALIGILISIKAKEKKLSFEIAYILSSVIWFFLVLAIARSSSFFVLIIPLLAPIIVRLIHAIIKNEKIDTRTTLFLLIWFAGTLYATTKGIRFALLVVPVFSIAIGIALGKLDRFGTEWVANQYTKQEAKKQNMKIASSIVIGILLLGFLLFLPIASGNSLIKIADSVAKNELPSMNDQWVEVLSNIKDNSQGDAIITSWWDFGHWFKAIADRPVTFDGGSQNRPQAHWVGKLLSTNDENLSVGILRMLDCGANDAFDILKENDINTIETVHIINEIVVLNKENARTKLLEHVDQNTADKVLEKTHCTPPEAFVITSEDMVGKAGVWAHFGNWDFTKSEVWLNRNKLDDLGGISYLQERYGLSENTASKYYYDVQSIGTQKEGNNWISPWPGIYGGGKCADKDNKTILCPLNLNNQRINIEINKNTHDAIVAGQEKQVYVNSISYVDAKEEFMTKEFKGDLLGYSITLINDGGKPTIVLLDPLLVDSMFVRMFYHNGAGLKKYNQFDASTQTGFNIFTYTVDWD